MRTIEEHVRNLCQWPHRGTTTGYEHRAADYVRDKLNELGYEVEEETFRAPDGALYRTFIVIIVCEIVATVFSFAGSGASILLAAMPFFYLFAKFYLMWPLDSFIFPSGKSRNVIGRLGNSEADKRVVLMAHIDTQLGSFLFERRWIDYHGLLTNATAVGSISVLILSVFRVAGGGGWFLTALQLSAVAIMLPGLFLFLRAAYTGQYVQGAGDDASGVGVILALAEELKIFPPKNLDVWILATGAEETGENGIIHFLKRGAGKRLDKTKTFFINHDNLGGGHLRFLTGEVMKSIKYPDALIKIAREVARDPDYPEASPGFWDVPTDALPVAIKGFPVTTLFAYDDHRRSPNYHLTSDTVENIDFEVPDAARRFALGLIRYLDNGSGDTGT